MKIDDKLLDDISRAAMLTPRLRMNHNIHKDLESPCQRLLNVLLPGTILPVHRHQNTDETYILLRGRLDIVLYADNGAVIDRIPLDPQKGLYGYNISAGQWHTVEVMKPSTIFEVKEGPYRPLEPEDIMY